MFDVIQECPDMLDINIHRLGQISIIEAIGRVDGMNADQLTRALNEEFDSGRSRIILDLAGVNFMSGAGLKTLKKFHDRAGGLRIARPSGHVREVFQIIGLDTVYQLFTTRVEAIHTITPITNAHTHLELG